MQVLEPSARLLCLVLLASCLPLAGCVPLRREPVPPAPSVPPMPVGAEPADPWEAPPRRAQ